jgi:hypothetical protein
MSDRPTPETDALAERLIPITVNITESNAQDIIKQVLIEILMKTTALERERDEALTAIRNYKCEVEAWELLRGARRERDEARAVAYDLAVIASHCLGSHGSELLTETSERIAGTLKRWRELKQ